MNPSISPSCSPDELSTLTLAKFTEWLSSSSASTYLSHGFGWSMRSSPLAIARARITPRLRWPGTDDELPAFAPRRCSGHPERVSKSVSLRVRYHQRMRLSATAEAAATPQLKDRTDIPDQFKW